MGTPRILVADNSEVHCRILSGVLRREAWDVVTAADGREAVEKASGQAPDVVILRGRMPGTSGVEACRALRRREETRRVPILIFTAEGDVEGLQAALASGCSDYFVAPLDFGELVARIRAYLHRPCTVALLTAG